MIREKSILVSFFAIFFLLAGKIAIASELKGYLDTDKTISLSESPLIITGDLYIRNGATLTIESGVEVELLSSSHEIFVGYTSTSTGNLVADNVSFNGYLGSTSDDDLYIRTGSTASLTNCTFNDIYVSITDASPTISNCTFNDLTTPLFLNGLCSPALSSLTFNNVSNPGIGFQGTFTSDYTLKDFGYPCFLSGDVSIRDGATLTIESGLNLGTISSSYEIHVGYTTTSTGNLVADNVSFNGYLGSTSDDDLYIRTGSTASLTNCTFNDIYVSITDASPTISNCTFNDLTTPLFLNGLCSPALSSLTFNNVSNPGIGFQGTFTSDFTTVSTNIKPRTIL